ncbi:MAG: FAD:protein FMN transferase [Phycisphaerae bacterium]|nr:FAD:protein FMN transferase [Phycisphaerae bacterium]
MPLAARIMTSAALLVAGCALSGCTRTTAPARVSRSREIMGTLATLTAVADDEGRAAAAVEAGYARLADVNRLMSDYVAESEIGRLNRLPAGSPVAVAPETFQCVQRAVEFARDSGGAFDVTCRPLVALWRAAGEQQRLPTADELRQVRDLVGTEKLTLDAGAHTITLQRAGMQIDLGGIAKGYALDLAAQAMRQTGAASLLIDVGGDVLALGCAPTGQPWHVGVKHPFTGGLIAVLQISDRAVATSGVQQRFHEIGGKRYSHIVDPRSGQPAEQAPSVTVIARDGITADAWATAFSVLSVAEGKELLAAGAAPGVEVLWITGSAAQPVLDQTPGFAAYMVR